MITDIFNAQNLGYFKYLSKNSSTAVGLKYKSKKENFFVICDEEK